MNEFEMGFDLLKCDFFLTSKVISARKIQCYSLTRIYWVLCQNMAEATGRNWLRNRSFTVQRVNTDRNGCEMRNGGFNSNFCGQKKPSQKDGQMGIPNKNMFSRCENTCVKWKEKKKQLMFCLQNKWISTYKWQFNFVKYFNKIYHVFLKKCTFLIPL